jgi:hypothetical protein
MPDYPFGSIGKKLVFETSYRSIYDIKELTDSRAAIAVTRNNFNFGGGIATFGDPGYFHQLGLSTFLSYRKSRLASGGSINYSRLSFNDRYGYLSVVTVNLGAAYIRDKLTIYGMTRSVNQPRYYAGSQPILPEAEFGISYKSVDGLDSQVKALFIRRRKPTAELSQSYRLSSYASLNWAMVLLPARFGAGLSLEKGNFGFDYKFSHHSILGPTHTVMLAVFKK